MGKALYSSPCARQELKVALKIVLMFTQGKNLKAWHMFQAWVFLASHVASNVEKPSLIGRSIVNRLQQDCQE